MRPSLLVAMPHFHFPRRIAASIAFRAAITADVVVVDVDADTDDANAAVAVADADGAAASDASMAEDTGTGANATDEEDGAVGIVAFNESDEDGNADAVAVADADGASHLLLRARLGAGGCVDSVAGNAEAAEAAEDTEDPKDADDNGARPDAADEASTAMELVPTAENGCNEERPGNDAAARLEIKAAVLDIVAALEFNAADGKPADDADDKDAEDRKDAWRAAEAEPEAAPDRADTALPWAADGTKGGSGGDGDGVGRGGTKMLSHAPTASERCRASAHSAASRKRARCL